MTFSIGCVQKLTKRHGMRSRRLHGEAVSVAASAVDGRRAALQRVTRDYHLCNVYNLDESAYFYCTVPSRAVTKASMAGRKKVKTRITVALTINADGSSRVPLFFVGSAR